MGKLLLVVDMQNDFITGALGTPEAVSIVPKVCRKVSQHLEQGGLLAFTLDTHGENYLETQEGKFLPVPHCVRGTWGWQFCPELLAVVDPWRHTVYEKETFGSSALARDLADGRYDGLDQVELVGLCTDICVVSNALLCKTFLPQVPVVVDGACCAGVTPQAHREALHTMGQCQVQVHNG